MELIIPEYYHKFHCIASDCEDSCCKEWSVDVDEASATLYRGLPGALGERLREVLMDTEDGVMMAIEDGRCPMWRQDGLCRIQAELGHDALCQVCQNFPRLRHDYGELVELGLELSCPEAARLILSATDDRVFTQKLPDDEVCEDPETLSILCRSRDTALTFLESAALPLPQTLAVLLLYSHDVQAEMDGGEQAVLDPEKLLEEAGRYAQSGSIQGIFDFFKGLEILTDAWRHHLESGPASPIWPVQLRRLVRYLIRRYWLQALADYDLVCRVKFIIIACLLVCHLHGDVTQTAQLFSKEIENDPDNVEAILAGAYRCPALTDVSLLGLLLLPN